MGMLMSRHRKAREAAAKVNDQAYAEAKAEALLQEEEARKAAEAKEQADMKAKHDAFNSKPESQMPAENPPDFKEEEILPEVAEAAMEAKAEEIHAEESEAQRKKREKAEAKSREAAAKNK